MKVKVAKEEHAWEAAHLLPLETLSISSFFLTAYEVPWGPYIESENARLKSTYLGRVDDLVGKRLLDGLQAAESRLTCALADQVDGLVDSA